jgi:O-antigen/teichoic acid export membrane protein
VTRRGAVFVAGGFRQTIGDSAWTVGATGVEVAARLTEVIVLARYLAPHDLGVFVLIIAYPETVQQVIDFRVREAMTRFLGEFIALGQRAHAAALVKLLWLVDVGVSAVALGVVTLTASFAAAHILHDAATARLMMICALGLFFASLDSASPTILRVLGRFPLSFLVASTTALIRLSVILFLVGVGSGIEGLIWGTVGASAAATIVSAAVALLALLPVLGEERHARLGVVRGRLKEIGGFLLNTNLAGSLRLASSKLDVLIVGLLTGPATVSIYKVAVQFGTAPFLVSEALFVAFYPSFVKLRSLGRFGEVLAIGRKTTMILSLVTVPVAAALAYESKFVIDATVGERYEAAALPFVILLLSSLPAFVLFWCRAALLSIGRADFILRIAAAAALIEMTGLFLLVPRFGASGAATSMAATNLSVALLLLWYLYDRPSPLRTIRRMIEPQRR